VERGPPNESEREREGGRERERERDKLRVGQKSDIFSCLPVSDKHGVKHLIRGNGGNRGLNWHNGVSQPVPPLLPVQPPERCVSVWGSTMAWGGRQTQKPWVSRVKVKVGSKGFQNI
jgi:hypothetical protein